MRNRKTVFLWLVFLMSAAQFFTIEIIYAQHKIPVNFGKVKVEDFNVQSPVIDTNSNAVIIADVGKTEFIANANENTFSFVFSRKTRIKIINKKGFNAAVITIPLYVTTEGTSEKLERLKATTYNIENGKVKETDLERKDLFTERHNKNLDYKKFTFPALQEGSIIEYSYEVKSDFFFNLQSWYFQGEYPVLWSQYDANIPEFFKYVILTHGYQAFFINEINEFSTSFLFSGKANRTPGSPHFTSSMGTGEDKTFKIEGIVEFHTWIMKDVPALREEPFTSTLSNSIAKIEFQLNQIAFPNTAPKVYMNSWQMASEQMLSNENFGLPLKRANNWLDDEENKVVKNAATPLEKAKKIYAYIRDNFTCTNYSRTNITTTLKEVFKTKSGSVADINLLLIAMLRNQQIMADPVILSTRSHGFTNQYYPLMEKFNYVIAQVIINDITYHLDASQPRLAFAKLPLHVYNGHARVVDALATPVFFEADSIAEGNSTSVIVSNTDRGGVEAVFQSKLGYYQSLSLRNKIGQSSLADYIKSLSEAFTEEITINNVQIDSLKMLDEPVELKYDLVLKLFGDADIVYLDPLLGENIKKNPFTALERFYPVEMPYAKNDVYVFKMEIPRVIKLMSCPNQPG